MSSILYDEKRSLERPGEACIEAAEREKLKKRLLRIEGQVRGVQRMVAEEAPCVDVITQISAIVAATRKVALLVLKDHAGHRVRHAAENGPGVHETVDEVLYAVESFVAILGKEREAGVRKQGRSEGRAHGH